MHKLRQWFDNVYDNNFNLKLTKGGLLFSHQEIVWSKVGWELIVNHKMPLKHTHIDVPKFR